MLHEHAVVNNRDHIVERCNWDELVCDLLEAGADMLQKEVVQNTL